MAGRQTPEPTAATRRLNASERRIVDVLAHTHVAGELEQHVAGFSGFGKHWRERVLSAAERRVLEALGARVKEVRRDLADMLERADWSRESGGGD